MVNDQHISSGFKPIAPVEPYESDQNLEVCHCKHHEVEEGSQHEMEESVAPSSSQTYAAAHQKQKALGELCK